MAKDEIKKIGISTGGGDCPGLNPVIRAVVHTAINNYGWEVIGIKDSFTGLIYPDQIMPLSLEHVRDILHKGGTIIGTTNRGNPFHWEKQKKDGSVEIVDYSDRVMENFEHLGLNALVVVGGDGTMKIAQQFFEKGMSVVGVPKTIDNDLSATDVTFGFDSAVRTASEALDKLRSTAESHHRVMVVEMMGRHSGWIALHSGLAGGAHVILIPEIPFDLELVASKLKERRKQGDQYSIIVVAEGAVPKEGEMSMLGKRPDGTVLLGGMGQKVGSALSDMTGVDIRVLVLGHLQRGGSPTEFDRILGTRYGEAATHLIAENDFGKMVALRGTAIKGVPITEAIGQTKQVYPDGTMVKVARSMGICFGDK
ncbi:MAG: 6-phosphofructokinase [Deltaproteobacteria bacterium]|nr:MAG: 6-phosphofructokinase [Deltaproteobacteria bacterium]